MPLPRVTVPIPRNEEAKDYAPGSPEREDLRRELERQRAGQVEIPLVIGGREILTGDTHPVVCPHDPAHPLGLVPRGGAAEADAAVRSALAAARDWRLMPWEDRAAIFLKAADLVAGRRRMALNAAPMQGQSKRDVQAEIDAACELADYLRFNVAYAARIYEDQLDQETGPSWTRIEHRPLEGFVYAVTPFNFTAINGNLPTAPAMMGNVVIWKPAGGSVLSAHAILSLLREAGLPDGVINFFPGRGRDVGPLFIDRPELAGLHFTGSTGTFIDMWQRVGGNLQRSVYHTYPRLVGETGGKGFVLAAPDAEPESLAAALFRGAFEYQGQKCSAASRAYIPRSL